MSKIGRNDPCPCGSGKKYKHCHWEQEQRKGMAKHTALPPATPFETLVNDYNTIPIVKLLAVLQLQLANHGQNVKFENMMRQALLKRKNADNRPFASWDRVKTVIGHYHDGELLDEPTNTFTDNAVYAEGNYIVYPGIYLNGTEILNQLLECIFIRGNELPDDFKKVVNDGAGILLFMSNNIAKDLQHTGYMYEERNDDIVFPEYNAFIEQVGAVVFSKEYLQKVCDAHNYDYSIMQNFILNIGDAALKEDDPEKNIVISKPLIEDGESIILYMSTTVVNAIVDFIYTQARNFSCYNDLLKFLYEEQFHQACMALANQKWAATDIQVPDDAFKLPIQEMVFQFDNQKFGYLCFIHTADLAQLNNPKTDSLFEQRNKQVIAHLVSLTSGQEFNVLSLFVLAESGHDVFFSWAKPSTGNQSMTFRYGELKAVAYSDNANSLTLWKFAKAYSKTNEKVRIMSMGGSLDAYSIYYKNHGSLLHSDEANPIGGMLMIAPGSSNDFVRSVQVKRDEHAVSIFINRTIGYIKVIRYKDYAPIYKMKEPHGDFRLVIESYKMPIWITNYQSKKTSETTWAHYLCEAVAFWLHKMKQDLAQSINELTLVQFEIEIILDVGLLKAEEFTVKEVDTDSVEIRIEIDAPRIRLHIPYEFLYVVWLADNSADKLLMRAVLHGIIQYTEASKREVNLSREQANQIVEKILQPAQAKMILFSDASSNVRLDDRGLPSIRYIQDTDVSFILDNLVDYLPAGFAIPVTITNKDEKIKLCDDIVTALLGVLNERLKAFEGEELIQWLIRANEKCVQVREFREILIPAKIACFSDFEKEVDELLDKNENLVTTAHALRTLIELVATNIPAGKKWANYDDIDELLAITNQIATWGSMSEAMRLGIDDPEMGLLPSGRIGTDKTFEKESLQPYSQARTSGEVFQYIEKFEKNYIPSFRKDSKPTEDSKVLDEAFLDQFGIRLTTLSQVMGTLINEGFKVANPCFKIKDADAKNLLLSSIPNITEENIQTTLNMLTLLQRNDLGVPPAGFRQQDIFPWRYSRQLSYLRRPLVKWVDENNDTYYFYGYRHLMAYIDNLLFLLYTGKLPETDSEKMKTWIAEVLSEKGAPFRNAVKDWLKGNPDLEVIDYEVKMQPGGPINAKKNYGDIDVMAMDHGNHIIYSIECKNSVGARNIHEMKVEMDLYLGREGQEKKAKIKKHVERDQWLKAHPYELNKLVKDPAAYKIVSLILTSEEIPLGYLAKEKVPLPILSFNKLKMDGVAALPK